MKYTVLWVPEAEQELARLWADGSVRREVTRAADAIDAALSYNPEHKGESRGPGKRIYIAPPLMVMFRVDSGDMKVHVLHVRLFLKRS